MPFLPCSASSCYTRRRAVQGACIINRKRAPAGWSGVGSVAERIQAERDLAEHGSVERAGDAWHEFLGRLCRERHGPDGRHGDDNEILQFDHEGRAGRRRARRPCNACGRHPRLQSSERPHCCVERGWRSGQNCRERARDDGRYRGLCAVCRLAELDGRADASPAKAPAWRRSSRRNPSQNWRARRGRSESPWPGPRQISSSSRQRSDGAPGGLIFRPARAQRRTRRMIVGCLSVQSCQRGTVRVPVVSA